MQGDAARPSRGQALRRALARPARLLRRQQQDGALPRRILAVGDGATDLAIRPAVDAFAAFTGFVRRAPVVASADVVIDSFAQLVELVLS